MVSVHVRVSGSCFICIIPEYSVPIHRLVFESKNRHTALDLLKYLLSACFSNAPVPRWYRNILSKVPNQTERSTGSSAMEKNRLLAGSVPCAKPHKSILVFHNALYRVLCQSVFYRKVFEMELLRSRVQPCRNQEDQQDEYFQFCMHEK